MQISLIIQMVLTIACENSEFVEETLGKLRYSSITILLLNNTRKHIKAIGNTYSNKCRLYFERLHETTEKNVKRNSYHRKSPSNLLIKHILLSNNTLVITVT